MLMEILGSLKSNNINYIDVTKIVKLRVIPPPIEGTRTVFKTHDKDALVKGIELESLICGNCEFVLVENVLAYNQGDVVLQCPKCKSFNEISNI
jgi:hypothetical protein